MTEDTKKKIFRVLGYLLGIASLLIGPAGAIILGIGVIFLTAGGVLSFNGVLIEPKKEPRKKKDDEKKKEEAETESRSDEICEIPPKRKHQILRTIGYVLLFWILGPCLSFTGFLQLIYGVPSGFGTSGFSLSSVMLGIAFMSLGAFWKDGDLKEAFRMVLLQLLVDSVLLFSALVSDEYGPIYLVLGFVFIVVGSFYITKRFRKQ